MGGRGEEGEEERNRGGEGRERGGRGEKEDGQFEITFKGASIIA